MTTIIFENMHIDNGRRVANIIEQMNPGDTFRFSLVPVTVDRTIFLPNNIILEGLSIVETPRSAFLKKMDALEGYQE